MKSFRAVFLIFCMLLLCSVSATAQAVEGISVNHRLMMADDQAEGGSITTLEVTVTNAGTSSLSEVLLVQNAPLELSDPLMQALHVNDLTAGSESKLLWELNSSMSADQARQILTGIVSLNLLGVDDFGQNVSLDITSEGGAE